VGAAELPPTASTVEKGVMADEVKPSSKHGAGHDY
jgi:hypothetical protein